MCGGEVVGVELFGPLFNMVGRVLDFASFFSFLSLPPLPYIKQTNRQIECIDGGTPL